jgi:serine/threonine protein kinase
MNPENEAELEIARRIADGESVDLAELGQGNPDLARRLGKLQSLAHAMQGSSTSGSRWGHLQQLQLAGQGGFGAVYRAYDPTLDRMVALKLRHTDGAAMLPSGADFVAEARRLARVRHPNVLAVHGASYHDGRAGLWTDWIDGETLTDRLERSGPLHGEELLRVLRELAEALEAVHSAGLVHGDVKASNVMLDRQSRVILMDFGAGFESSSEGSRQGAGTPRYLAPEVLAGGVATSAVDIYAFGVLAHLLASNRYPEPAQAVVALRPNALRKLMPRLLSDDANARPKAAGLRHGLQQMIDAPRRRARRFALGATIAGLAAVALVSVFGYQRAESLRAEAVTARDQTLATNRFLTDLLEAPSPDQWGRDVKVAELLDAATRRVTGASDLASPVRITLLHAIGGSNRALGRPRATEEALSQALQLAQSEPTADPVLLRRIKLKLAEARSMLDEWDAADAILAELAADPRWSGDAVAQAEIAIGRADALMHAGRIEEAGKVLTTTVLDTAGLDAHTRIEAGWNLGQLYNKQGRLVEGERTLRSILAESDKLGRTSFVMSIWIRNELATSLNQLGRFAEAETVYREAADRAKEAYGDRTLGTLAMKVNLSISLRDQGKYAEAEALQREMLELATSLDGIDARSTLTTRSSLAVTLHESGRDQESLAMLDENIPLLERKLGMNHPNTLIDTFNRVEIMNVLGRHADALAAGRALLPRMVEATGADHPFALETEDAIGLALTQLGQAAQALPMHRRTLELKTRMMGAETPYALISQEYLARALLALGRRDEALALLQPLLDARMRMLGADHQRTRTARELLAKATSN